MLKTLPALSLLFLVSTGFSQQNIMELRKGKKIIDRFWKGDVIAFQLNDKDWRKGDVILIQNDSIYIRPYILQFNPSGMDTARFNVEAYALADIYAMPKKGFLIDYKNGSFQFSRSGGHVHWYWVKSGWLFRAIGLGFTGLYLINGLISSELTISAGPLAIAAGVFLFGVLLKHLYKPYLRLRNKYHLEMIQM